MERTITIKGEGKVNAKPDLIILSINLESLDMDYQVLMKTANFQIEQLREAFAAIGFKKEELKTRDFNVKQKHDYDRNKEIHVFKGYACEHSLLLKFDFDKKVLGKVITALAESGTNPRFVVQYGVKDEEKVKEDLLADAVVNAKRKAEILTTAAKVSLGRLISINYFWGEIRLYSSTNHYFDMSPICLMENTIDIEPNDVNIEDSVTMVWEIT